MNLLFPVFILTVYCNAQFNIFTSKIPVGFFNHISGIYKGKLSVMYGYNDLSPGEWLDREYKTSVNPYQGLWIKSGGYPTDMVFIDVADESVQVDNLIYIINPWAEFLGGDCCGENSQTMYIHNLVTNAFSKSTTKFRGVHGCSVYDSKNHIIHNFGGILYVGGGIDSYSYSNTHQSYNINNMSWSSRANIPNGKASSACEITMDNKFIYDFGGSNGRDNIDALNTISKYSIDDNKWNVLPEKLSVARYSFVCKLFPVNNLIFCMGGQGNNILNSVEIFDPTTETIVDIINMNYARKGFTANLRGHNCMIIVGGIEEYATEYPYGYVHEIEYYGNCTATTIIPTMATETPTIIPTVVPTQMPSIVSSQSDSTVTNKNLLIGVCIGILVFVAVVFLIIILWLINKKRNSLAKLLKNYHADLNETQNDDALL
eukprot:254693_1